MKIKPWYTPQAIEYLDALLEVEIDSGDKNKLVFEFGGGMSTQYYLNKGFNVQTIEHSAKFAIECIERAVSFESLERLKLVVAARPYHEEILKCNSGLLLVAIDGRDRSKCMNAVRQNLIQVTPKYVLLDNSERRKYREEFTLLQEHYDFQHFVHPSGWTTSIGSSCNPVT